MPGVGRQLPANGYLQSSSCVFHPCCLHRRNDHAPETTAKVSRSREGCNATIDTHHTSPSDPASTNPYAGNLQPLARSDCLSVCEAKKKSAMQSPMHLSSWIFFSSASPSRRAEDRRVRLGLPLSVLCDDSHVDHTRPCGKSLDLLESKSLGPRRGYAGRHCFLRPFRIVRHCSASGYHRLDKRCHCGSETR